MDLIYTNPDMDDVGVIQDCSLDLAFGLDENNFELKVRKDNYELEIGSMIYIEDSEIGGIVDGIEVASGDSEETYFGRSLQGILASKIIQPQGDYFAVFGDANECIAKVIGVLGVDNIFIADTEPSNIQITGYQFERYVDGYTGLCRMLNSVFAKLIMKWHNGRCYLSAKEYIDYSQDEEFDTSVVEMKIKKLYHPVNHLICLGKGNLSQRKVIHLFTDEEGGIQPYSLIDEPYQDSQYILDNRNQVVTGFDEILDVYDYSSAEQTENYIALENAPSDWTTNSTDYFIAEENGGFKAVDLIEENLKTVLYSRPSDWNTNYSKYLELVDGEYRSVEGIEQESYVKLNEQPAGWASNYSSFYYYWTDGVTSEYRLISADTAYNYKIQTQKPSDWDSSYSSYYNKNSSGKFVSVEGVIPTFRKNTYYEQSTDAKYIVTKTKPTDWTTHYTNYYKKKDGKYVKLTDTSAPTWKANTYYERKSVKKYTLLTEKPNNWNSNFDNYYQKTGSSYSKVTKSGAIWKANTYYTKYSNSVAPSFTAQNVYTKNSSTTAPSFVAGKYYSEAIEKVAPPFVAKKFFKLYVDDFAVLVAGGIERLKELWSKDEIQVTFDSSDEYDIGDVIGATQELSNIAIRKQIVKKIVNISNYGIKQTSYEIGDKI